MKLTKKLRRIGAIGSLAALLSPFVFSDGIIKRDYLVGIASIVEPIVRPFNEEDRFKAYKEHPSWVSIAVNDTDPNKLNFNDLIDLWRVKRLYSQNHLADFVSDKAEQKLNEYIVHSGEGY